MTKKQEQILQTAIELFLQYGYHASTSKKIAREAGVSEGLIFRHFTDKKGLLEAVIMYCDDDLATTLSELQFEEDTKLVLQKIIQLPHTLYFNDNKGLQLLFKLHYELGTAFSKSINRIKQLLESVFTQLNYKHPIQETELLFYYLNGLSSSLGNMTEENLQDMQKLVLNKYYLN